MKNNKLIYLALFLIITIFIQGCSSKKIISGAPASNDKSFPNKYPYNYEITQSIDYNKLYNNLLSQYKEWKGVKYKYGGNSKSGIDCSAFIQKTFKDKLNIILPRTTTYQATYGKEIHMENLEMGDLIFFKTGYDSRHVGIYLGEGKFMHASTKRGVTISRLDNPYYSSHFWKIQRVIQTKN